MWKIISVIFMLVTRIFSADVNSIPDNLLIGAATSAYMIEGAANTNGKGENILDHMVHLHPDWIVDNNTPDIAADSYHKYKDDIKALKDVGGTTLLCESGLRKVCRGDVLMLINEAIETMSLLPEQHSLRQIIQGNKHILPFWNNQELLEFKKHSKIPLMQHYRFSVAWSRVLPTGDITVINQEGIDYYNALINEMIANDIQPMLTMYHFDLPQPLQDLGGWVNPVIVDYFEDYARLLYKEYGDRVKWWLTLNEPLTFIYGYASSTEPPAPGVNAPGIGEYLAGHNALKAHARAYHVYDEEFRAEQKGKVSIVLSSDCNLPLTNDEDGLKAANMAYQYTLGWFAHPIFSEEGDYPAIMKERIGNRSLAEGRYRSRLPEFDEYWINYIKGTADYFSINHYTSYYASLTDGDSEFGYQITPDPQWEQSAATWLYFVPEGMRGVLNWITDEYNHPDIFITENGWGDTGGLNDTKRTEYHYRYMAEMLKAVHIDNVSIIGYTAWDLIDGFSFRTGHTLSFGIYDVDFEDPNRPRTPKLSAKAFANIISTRKIPEEYFSNSF